MVLHKSYEQKSNLVSVTPSPFRSNLQRLRQHQSQLLSSRVEWTCMAWASCRKQGANGCSRPGSHARKGRGDNLSCSFNSGWPGLSGYRWCKAVHGLTPTCMGSVGWRASRGRKARRCWVGLFGSLAAWNRALLWALMGLAQKKNNIIKVKGIQ